MNYIAYLFTAASILGTVANSLQKRWCFWVWLCTNSFWCIYNAAHGQYAQMLLYSFNLAMCVVGLKEWKKPEEAEEEPHSKPAIVHPRRENIQMPAKLPRRPMNVLEWYESGKIMQIKNRALKHKKHRVRKKNLARFWREYRKYIRRNGRA